jgi:transcription initiation factor TFIID subunit 11
MEHFLNNADDHNSSFFQPPPQDDESDAILEQHSPSHMETISPIKPEGSVQKIDRPRSNLNIDEEANIKLQVLVSNFSDEQLDRYEMYRRSAFSKISIKRLMHSITGSIPSSNVVIAMAGIAKVFVGEIVEEALEVQRQENENKSTPLEPKHLREADRRINNHYHCPQRKTWKSKKKSRF